MTGAVLVAAVVLAALPWLVRRSARSVGSPLSMGSVRSVESNASWGGPAARRGTSGGAVPRRGSLRWPWRWPVRGSGPAVDPALLLDLVAIALEAGAPVPAALASVGVAWPGAAGEAMVRAAGALSLGASWEVAWSSPTPPTPPSMAGGVPRRAGVPPEGAWARGGRRAAASAPARGARGLARSRALPGTAPVHRSERSRAPAGARVLRDALEPAWSAGASPVPLLRTAAARLRSRRRARTREAAGRLGVQLVVPLALCYLPAFVLVGLVPVVVSLAAGLFR